MKPNARIAVNMVSKQGGEKDIHLEAHAAPTISERTCQSPPPAATLRAGLVLTGPSGTAAPQMRLSGWNNPFELLKANAPPNPFMSGSCDKHFTSSESLSPPFVKRMLSIHRFGRHVRRRRIESEEEERMQRGSKLPVITQTLPWPSLPGEERILRAFLTKKNF